VDPGAGSSLFFWLGLLASGSIVLFALTRGDDRRAAPPPDHYRAALLHILRNDLDAAIDSLRLTIQSASAPPDAYIQLGNLLRVRGDHVAALQLHQSLTVRRDLSTEERIATLRALVEDYRALGQRSEALRTLESLAELRRDAAVVGDLARESLLLGRYDPAVDCMRELQRSDPNVGKPELATFLAAVAAHGLARDRPAEARRFLQQALKEDDSCPQALDLSGDVALQDGDAESALYYWQKLAFSGQAAAPDVHEKLERVYFELGKFGEIERVYSQILERRPRDLRTLLAAARIALKKGEAADAERLLQGALDVAARSTTAFRMLAGLWLDEGEVRRVRELIDAHVETCALQETLACPRCGTRSTEQPGYCVGCGRFGAYEPST
jgi:lipopolysaccharide biosynthesis regulator YciM